MARRIIFVTGGARSGKSKYAEARAEALGKRPLYFATAEAMDEEMAQRIAAHRKRRGEHWETVEEPFELAQVLLSYRGRADCALVDCLTLWLSNLLLLGGESAAEARVKTLLETLPSLDFHVVLVGNEVGCGVVPENALARRFRDLAGWTHQRVAAAADEVVLMVAGTPLTVKR
ncbi:MAG TPA: bifunctional adenosylcobinamide kinase/adenosylcobinamide-phosphate guanylyltransferase [candidate division Zixibacteria bacterium]|nr:bifunctional adenosylcobinamide kinase/adenosylcobinamide-phosphate guanylyltransferase [candidate division Zixibacteria bacterium]